MTYYLSYYNDTLADGAVTDISKRWRFIDSFMFSRERGNRRTRPSPETKRVYRRGSATITGSGGGARVFRWELGTSAGKVPGNIESMLRMTRECWIIDIAGRQ